MSEIETRPKADKRDIIYKAAKFGAAVAGGVAGVATGIPGVSTAASELFSAVIKPPLTKRTEEFLERICTKLDILEGKVEGFTIESLKDNDLFISVIWQATQKALHNHQQEKLEALQNAVLNCAMGIDIDQNTQMMLLRYIDDFTPLHLKMLALLESPREYLQKINHLFPDNITSTHLEGLIQHAIPEFHKKHEDIRIIYRDLFNHGLLNTNPDSLGVGMSVSGSGIYAQRTTGMARVLLRYISAPREIVVS